MHDTNIHAYIYTYNKHSYTHTSVKEIAGDAVLLALQFKPCCTTIGNS